MGTLVAGICLLLFFILIGRNSKRDTFMKRVATLGLKVAWVIVLLFVLNLIVSKVGIAIPINLFSILTIVLLGFPGMICLALLIVFNN